MAKPGTKLHYASKPTGPLSMHTRNYSAYRRSSGSGDVLGFQNLRPRRRHVPMAVEPMCLTNCQGRPMAKRKVGVECQFLSPYTQGGITRQGVVLTDLQSLLLDCQSKFSLYYFPGDTLDPRYGIPFAYFVSIIKLKPCLCTYFMLNVR